MTGSAPGGLQSAARTHVGKVRKLNEDSFVDRPEAGLFAVADGMGGLSRGDHASGLLRSALENIALPDDLPGCVQALRDEIQGVNSELHAAVGGGRQGSTIVAVVVRGASFACLWAGDSRLYRNGRAPLDQITRDHSLVQDLVDSGAVSPAAARRHPLSNRITRAVGVESRVDIDVAQGELRSGDRMLLSSDGLHGFVDEEEIARLVGAEDLGAAADALIEAALDAGGRDNITVVLLGMTE